MGWDNFWDRFTGRTRHFGRRSPAGSPGTSRNTNDLPSFVQPRLRLLIGETRFESWSGRYVVRGPAAAAAAGLARSGEPAASAAGPHPAQRHPRPRPDSVTGP